MLIAMNPRSDLNYILSYESAAEALKSQPHDRDLQHRAVLSLARAGALDFAISEYERFGLGNVKEHEDIMALGGRLSKDLYLLSTGPLALEYANDAALKYAAAFEATQGYYSGINSATMAYMAERPAKTVAELVQAVEAILPSPENLTREDHYFIEATRAECLFLRGNRIEAIKSLQSAVNFDPLNYSAHATTLKQFKMIAKKRSESANWLGAFNPPRPTHFAGRIKIRLSDMQLEQLKIVISDTIQKNDIGFGFGSLAAGYDIILAEALLEEGAALHVVLPCPVDRFVEHSVEAFGQNWLSRFHHCLDDAASIHILDTHAPWPDRQINRLTGQMSMGLSILMAQSLSVDPMQILVLGENSEASYTSQHAHDWANTGYTQLFISNGQTGNPSAPSLSSNIRLQATLHSSTTTGPRRYESPQDALKAASKIRKVSPNAQVVLHIAVPGVENDPTSQYILDHGAPHSILLSEAFASLLAFSEQDKYEISYAGQIKSKADELVRCYTVNID